MTQVFVSHTKKDRRFCDEFDNVCASVGMKRFNSDFETIPNTAWKTIKEEMNKSIALFFLVGEELVNSQNLNDTDWRYTQNWIAYEMGLACQLGIDVWAICDNIVINFPMPYINNYLTVGLRDRLAFDYLKEILEAYKNGRNFPFPFVDGSGDNFGVSCPYGDCKMEFNLHVELHPGDEIKCPQCLREVVFPNGT